MTLPLIPLTIATLSAGLFFSSKSDAPPKGQVTPARALIFETAMNEERDATKLRKLANAYREQGLAAHADLLEKRAKLRELPPEVKLARRAAFKKAMSSTDADAIRKLADAYEKEGATGSAQALRSYADSLKVAVALTPQPPPTPAANPPVAPPVDHPATATPGTHGEG